MEKQTHNGVVQQWPQWQRDNEEQQRLQRMSKKMESTASTTATTIIMAAGMRQHDDQKRLNMASISGRQIQSMTKNSGSSRITSCFTAAAS